MSTFTNPQAYERWMGRWSARLAPDFVRFAGLEEGWRVLDVGAGTGVLGKAVGQLYASVNVVGVEPAREFVTYAQTVHRDPRLSFHAGDAQAIPFEDASFDATLALLILQELPDAETAIQEMRRVTKPGGPVAACQWDFINGLPMTRLFWETVEAVYPDFHTQVAAAQRNPPGYCDEDALASVWRKAGLKSPETARLEIEMEFLSFDDYWAPFLSNASPTSSFAGTLPPAIRRKIADALRERLVSGSDRPFTLKAAAVAVRGTTP